MKKIISMVTLLVFLGYTSSFAQLTGEGIYGGGTGTGSGDIEGVWDCVSGDCNALTAASGDSFDGTLADTMIPYRVTTGPPVGACTKNGQTHFDSTASSLYTCVGGTTWSNAIQLSDSGSQFKGATSNGLLKFDLQYATSGKIATVSLYQTTNKTVRVPNFTDGDIFVLSDTTVRVISAATGGVLYVPTTGTVNAISATTAGHPMLAGGASTAPSYAPYALPLSLTTGGIFTALQTTTVGPIASTTAGNPLLAGGAATSPSYAPYSLPLSLTTGGIWTSLQTTTVGPIASTTAGHPLFAGGLTTSPAYAPYAMPLTLTLYDILYAGTNTAMSAIPHSSVPCIVGYNASSVASCYQNISLDNSAQQFYDAATPGKLFGISPINVTSGSPAWLKPICSATCAILTPTLATTGTLLMSTAATITANVILKPTGTQGQMIPSGITEDGTDVNIAALNFVAQGTITGRMKVVPINTTTTYIMSAADTRGQLYVITTATLVVFQTTAEATHLQGASFCVRALRASSTMIKPAAASIINNEGTALTASSMLVSAANSGDRVCLVAMDNASGGTAGWDAYVGKGTWTGLSPY